MTKKDKSVVQELENRMNEFLRFCRMHRIPAYIMAEPEGTIEESTRTIGYVTPEELNLCMSDDNVTKLMLMKNENLRLTPIKQYESESKTETDAVLDSFLSDDDDGEDE